jgi:hypothetical protein
MNADEFRAIAQEMIIDARDIFWRRAETMIAGQGLEARAFAYSLAGAIGEVSPYDALAALEQWLEEQRVK